jgi:CHRD domain-containing protein
MLIDFTDTSSNYNLKFSGLDAPPQQAHMHIAQKGVNGGIMIFFCTNLGNGPLGTPACPASANLSGTVTASDVINGASAQGVSTGEFAEVLGAIRAGTAYVNVHSTSFPGGAIRGQIVPDPKTATVK